MWDKIVLIITNLLKSFTADKGGASGRKLSAFNSMVNATLLSSALGYYCYIEKEPKILFYLIAMWIIASFVFLALITIPQLLEFYKMFTGSKSDTEITETESGSKTKIHEASSGS